MLSSSLSVPLVLRATAYAHQTSSASTGDALILPDPGPYSVTESVRVCRMILIAFYTDNAHICRSQFDSREHSYGMNSKIVQSYNGQLCGNPGFPEEYSRQFCDGVTRCRFNAGYKFCPKGFLEEHLNGPLYMMKCHEPTPRAAIEGDWPNTNVVCLPALREPSRKVISTSADEWVIVSLSANNVDQSSASSRH